MYIGYYTKAHNYYRWLSFPDIRVDGTPEHHIFWSKRVENAENIKHIADEVMSRLSMTAKYLNRYDNDYLFSFDEKDMILFRMGIDVDLEERRLK